VTAGAPAPELVVSARAALATFGAECVNAARALAAGLATAAAGAAAYCDAVTAGHAAAVAARVQAPAREGDRA